ncbi:pyruvate, phosphate dikinase/phosphoenolpyruvate synthase regulator [Nocardioides sp. C4-1]|uniref:pyruvate, water dikinase regulatory protein n=1 Tax=Nocardioides sp. C4-1 TaxID=3151851 RepID=UPI0032638D3B
MSEVGDPDADGVVPVFFLSDSTGISAETMGNALLIQFPDLVFERTTIPFIGTVEKAREVVAILDEAMDGPVTPLAFTTAAEDQIRLELARTRAPIIDFFEMHMGRVEQVLGQQGVREVARLHGVGDIKRYNTRMAAVEFTIEHDDGQSLRALDRADVVLLAPSRCGKTPTSMYLALQHGLFVANYPLVDEDLESRDLPRPVRDLADRCFGITTTADRLSRVRNERRPGSRYAELSQCRWELRQAGLLFDRHRIPTIDSATKSVEEMAALVLQTLKRNGGVPSRERIKARDAQGGSTS